MSTSHGSLAQELKGILPPKAMSSGKELSYRSDKRGHHSLLGVELAETDDSPYMAPTHNTAAISWKPDPLHRQSK